MARVRAIQVRNRHRDRDRHRVRIRGTYRVAASVVMGSHAG